MNVAVIFASVLIGTGLGGILGLLIEIGALALPTPVPLVAAGALAATLGAAGVCAVMGLLIGGLIGVLVSFRVGRPTSGHE